MKDVLEPRIWKVMMEWKPNKNSNRRRKMFTFHVVTPLLCLLKESCEM